MSEAERDMAEPVEGTGWLVGILTALMGGSGGWGFLRLHSTQSAHSARLDDMTKRIDKVEDSDERPGKDSHRVTVLEERVNNHSLRLQQHESLLARIDERTEKTDRNVEKVLDNLRGQP